MSSYNDLIYYKQDIINEYSNKRKHLDKKEVDDLLRCALLFLEEQSKRLDISSIEIPNIGFLHKKLDFSTITTKDILLEDSKIAECGYLETKFLPICMREDMIKNYYPGLSKKELQLIQNTK